MSARFGVFADLFMRLIATMFMGALCISSARAEVLVQKDAVSLVRTLLHASPDKMDYGQIKLAVDSFVDPSQNSAAVETELAAMLAEIGKMLATLPSEQVGSSMERMKALRAFLYQSGRWNKNSPFQYDLNDPYGKDIGTQQLSTYIATKKGNCVSMPLLFLVLGERLGLKVGLSTAPLHIFIKFTDDATGKTWNLETTSGAGFTRDLWYQQKLPMTPKSIETGAYLKILPRQQTVAVITTLILDHLLKSQRYEEAIAVADLLLEAWPEDVYALVKKGTAYRGLLQDRVIAKYPKLSDMPPNVRLYGDGLYKANQEAFKRAEELGWTPTQ
ncbi:transglutaminase family protein [Labrys sp. KB_33_2]|uniref:transglutaminase family protein n=1 Tax=Labrys sp. KB_33_2 TaxID=3237479 RepID=UPI003F8E5F53